MVNWYRHDIPSWMDSTESLSDGAYRIYHVACQLIYLNEGPITLNERGIAGRCCLRIDRFRVYLKELLDLRKLTLVEGKLSNARCLSELAQIDANRANASMGGKAPRRKLSDSSPLVLEGFSSSSPLLLESSPRVLVDLSNGKSLINNEPHQASLQINSTEKTREEKTKKESCTVAKATRTKQEYSEEFETGFWQPYPRTQTMSKIEAWRVWVKITPEQRALACQAVLPYKNYLQKKPNLETVHACRFLSQRRYEGFSGANNQPIAEVFNIRGSLV